MRRCTTVLFYESYCGWFCARWFKFSQSLQYDQFILQAIMSMFQILTQKGWVAVMHDTMDVVDSAAVTTGVAIYFVFYHLFVTLVRLEIL